jgi:DNA repair exonuclease SbcCD ATPase subunit
MNAVRDFRAVLAMSLNALERRAESEPTAKEIANELRRSGGEVVDLIDKIKSDLSDSQNEVQKWRENAESASAGYLRLEAECKRLQEESAEAFALWWFAQTMSEGDYLWNGFDEAVKSRSNYELGLFRAALAATEECMQMRGKMAARDLTNEELARHHDAGCNDLECVSCEAARRIRSISSLESALATLTAEYERLKLQQYTADDAHEIWALAQLLPGEGIEDGVGRIADFFKRAVLAAGEE